MLYLSVVKLELSL